MFELIADMEDSEAFLPTYSSAAAWLRWHLGVNAATARSYVRISRRLCELPMTAGAVWSGSLSVDRLRLLLRVVEPETEAELVAFAAQCHDIDVLRERVADIETALAETSSHPDKPIDQPRASLVWRNDVLHLKATVPGVDGVVVEQAIQRLANSAPKEPSTALYRPVDERDGQALVQIASESIAADGDHDRATIVVHTTTDDAGNPVGWDTSGRLFNRYEMLRLMCDARIQP